MLILGIIYRMRFMLSLRRLRMSMREEGLIHGETDYPVSLTLITAILLLVIGLLAIIGMDWHLSPFGQQNGAVR